MDLKALLPEKDTNFPKLFGFDHDPARVDELLNSTVEPTLSIAGFGRLASKKELKVFEGYLKFPSSRAELHHLLYEKYSSFPLNKEVYDEYIDKMKELGRFIKAAETDDEKWLNWITKAENDRFIQVNIEYRLSKDMENRKLWDLYLRYLKETNPKEMLQLYSKYCRYFPDDIELNMSYWKAAKLHGPSYVNFKKLFDFEKPAADEPLASFNRRCVIPRKNLEPPIRFSPENAQNQTFSFKSPLMKHILLNANGTVLLKLHQTCKYFFIKRPILPCYRFVLINLGLRTKDKEYKFEVVENSIEYTANISPPSNEKDLYITTSLYVDHPKSTMLSSFINEKFYKCDAKHIEIKNQLLPEKEFDFLVGHGNVESCCLESVTILKENGTVMELDEILAKMPKLRFFTFIWMKVTNEILEKLQLIPFQNKFLCCKFGQVFNVVDPRIYFDFIKKNAAPISTFKFFLRRTVPPQIANVFRNEMIKLLDEEWHLDQTKPKLLCHVFAD